MGNSVMMLGLPGVMRPIAPLPSVNHRLPSGAATMSCGLLLAVGSGNSVMVFGLAGLIRPTWLPVISTNQRLPSGPAVMPAGRMSADDMGNSVMVFGAAGRMRPMVPGSDSVNQRFASGPVVMSSGKLNGDARNSVKHCPCAVTAATSRTTPSTNRNAPLGFMTAPYESGWGYRAPTESTG